MKRTRGFTLIELLVVIAIIGLLASIILASLDSARKKGRDARRIADLKQLQLALELYQDASGTFPVVSSLGAIPSVLAPTYISSVPTDPTNSGVYIYQYESLATDGTTACTSGKCTSFLITGRLESSANASSWVGSGGAIPSGGCPALASNTTAPYYYCVHS
ncbi:MAG TPA: prepilin-type N-terminal cleavage/methylation domain-containing protein [Candidatus Paceibacterota bacterium]|nr:prepilin-type N-terminal cleavage/methylation domain-containing protein [Candidatus Paceibacterota bacterium]